MGGFILEEGERFSLLRAPGFAPGHTHAFVVRGWGREILFKPGPIPREEICRRAGLRGARLHLPDQVHGASVIEVPRQAPRGELTESLEADALITRRAHHAVGVTTADCLPILLAAPSGAGAAVHAGWRGLLAGVVGAAVAALKRQAAARSSHIPGSVGGEEISGPIQAGIGPAIGPCCFEVGSEVAERFLAGFPASGGCLVPTREKGKSFVDLPEAARAALGEAGLDRENIFSSGLCTRCGGESFESYRRDGPLAGRMVSLIAPAPSSLNLRDSGL